MNIALEITDKQCFRNIIHGHGGRQQQSQWKIPLTPRLKDRDDFSGQEKCALKYVNKRKAEKNYKGEEE